MKIIKDNSHEIKCNHCESILHFNDEDVYHETVTLHFSIRSVSYNKYTIKCPICNKEINVSSKIKK